MKTNEQHSKDELEENKSELDILKILEQMGINRSSLPYDLFPPNNQ